MGGKGSVVGGELFITITSYKYVTVFSIWTRFSCLWTWTAISSIAERKPGLLVQQNTVLGKSEHDPLRCKPWSEGLQERAGIGFLSDQSDAICPCESLKLTKHCAFYRLSVLHSLKGPWVDFKVSDTLKQIVWGLYNYPVTFSFALERNAFQGWGDQESHLTWEQIQLTLFPISWPRGIKFNYQHFHSWREMCS